MPLAWPWAPAFVNTWRFSVLTLTLLLMSSGKAVGDHHHHHHQQQHSPLQLLNPWLSACDLAQPSTAPDLQGSCSAVMAGGRTSYISSSTTRVNGDIAEGPGPPPPETCPRACGRDDASNNQCLYYFNESHKESMCNGVGLTEARLSQHRLRHCCEHSVASSLTPEALKAVFSSSIQCSHYLGALLELDALAARISCEFGEVLTRYDCDHPYSVNYRCADCQEAYRRWVCTSLIPHFPKPGKSRVRPCRSVCRTVEQRCPFFLPGDRAPAYPTQYAGEPTFLCLDPNIPESGEQLLKSSYGGEGCCYQHCGTPVKGLCLSSQDCMDQDGHGNGSTPSAVQCTPPPSVAPPQPGDRTLPSACGASMALVPPPRSSSSSAILPHQGLLGFLVLYYVYFTASVWCRDKAKAVSPARVAVAMSSRSRVRRRRRPSRTLAHAALSIKQYGQTSRSLLLLLRREWLPKNRIGNRTTIISSLFCFVEHVT